MFNYVGLKKKSDGHKFFKDKKIRIFFRNLYNNNNNNVFHVRMVLYDHLRPNVENPLLPYPYYIGKNWQMPFSGKKKAFCPFSQTN